mgnify:CR=1 FL=1
MRRLSWQAQVLGFPNAFLGLIFEPIVITIAVAALGRVRFPRWFMVGAQVMYLIAIGFAIACVFLSNWQFERNESRAEQIALVEQNYDAPAVPLADVLQAGRDAVAARIVPFRALLPELPSVTLRSALQLERLKNGVELGPADLESPLAVLPPITRLLGPDGDLVGLAKPGKTPGFLHGWIVLTI